STLSSNMLNQLRLGKSGSNNWQWGSADVSGALGAQARALQANANGIPYQVGFAAGLTDITSFTNKGGFGRVREGINPRYSIGDDVSWTVRRHAFKGGWEFRRTESNGFNDPNYTPLATLGGGANPAVLDGNVIPGLTATNATLAKNILYDLTGSVSNVNEAFGVLSAQDTTIRATPEIRNNRHWNYQN